MITASTADAQSALATLSHARAARLLARQIATMDDAGKVEIVSLGEALDRGLSIASRTYLDLSRIDDDRNAHVRSVRGEWRRISTAAAWIVQAVPRYDADQLLSYARQIVAALDKQGIKATVSTVAESETVYVTLKAIGNQRSLGSAVLTNEPAEYAIKLNDRMPDQISEIIMAAWEAAT